MADVDELLRSELHLAAEPGDPVGAVGTFAMVALVLARELASLGPGAETPTGAVTLW